MFRNVVLALLAGPLALACGPEASTTSATAGSGTGSASGMHDSTGRETATGASVGSADDSTGLGSTTGAMVCEGEGGGPLSLGTVRLQPGGDPRPNSRVTGEFDCAVSDVTEGGAGTWEVQLQCDGTDSFVGHVHTDFGMFDPTWIGRTVVLAADASWDMWFGGWYAVRDDQGELLFATGLTVPPPPAATAPFTVEWVDLGETCPSNDGCLIVYSHMLAFTSDADGTLYCYDGGGHTTDTYHLTGSSKELYNPDPPPFGDCVVNDAPGVVNEFLIVRHGDG